ncbi:hypothetical protein MASR2M78_24770 [Treponema sp.]
MYSHNARYFDVDNFVITSPSIHGPWSEPIYLHSVGFDPSFLHDEDGKKYVACLEWDLRPIGHPAGIVIQEYDPVKKAMVGPLKQVWDGGTKRGCVEGPHLYKKDGWYYLMAAEGGTGYGHCVTMARSRSIWGPYEGDPANPILTATDDFDESHDDWFLKTHRYNPASILQKVGHASWVETAAGEHYAAHLCARPFLPELRCTLGREAGLQKMYWTGDGWLRLQGGGNRAKMEVEEPAGLHRAFDESQAANAGMSNKKIAKPEHLDRDDFDGDWDPRLVSARVSRNRFASTSERPGFLRLHGQQSLCSLDTVAFIARRLTSVRSDAACVVDFNPLDYRQSAGLVAYYDNMNHIFLRIHRDLEDGPRQLSLTRLENGERREVPCATLDEEGSVYSKAQFPRP